MTKEEWKELVERTMNKMNDGLEQMSKEEPGPEDWKTVKGSWNEAIEEIDNITEVYFSDNAKRDTK